MIFFRFIHIIFNDYRYIFFEVYLRNKKNWYINRFECIFALVFDFWVIISCKQRFGVRCSVQHRSKVISLFLVSETITDLPSVSQDHIQELENRVRNLEDQTTCTICMEASKDMIFQCGHGVCEACSPQLQICHLCRVPISTRIKTYWPIEILLCMSLRINAHAFKTDLYLGRNFNITSYI